MVPSIINEEPDREIPRVIIESEKTRRIEQEKRKTLWQADKKNSMKPSKGDVVGDGELDMVGLQQFLQGYTLILLLEQLRSKPNSANSCIIFQW